MRLEENFLQQRSRVERIGDAIGSFAGSMLFVVIHVVLIIGWFLVNTRVIPLVPVFDPYPFILLSMTVSIEAVILSTFVLMRQNREGKRAEHRQHLTLQIDLLAEQEATKTLQLLQRICKRLGMEESGNDAETTLLSESTAIAELAEELQQHMPRD